MTIVIPKINFKKLSWAEIKSGKIPSDKMAIPQTTKRVTKIFFSIL
ncbi:MAG: hypothetical protein WC682_00805 [Parcubacteria group bacterium]|jgi:hypothetical protein